MVRNDDTRWGSAARLLHWLGALMILTLLIHGWWMQHVALRPDRAAHHVWHAALGYDLMALLVLRLLWRWANPVPALPTDLKPWELWSARLTHVGLYVLMLAVTLVGWALAGTGRTQYTTDLFNLPVPLFYRSADRGMHVLLEDTHRVMAYMLAVLVAIHVAGALRHHFLKRNNVLRRMVTGDALETR